MDEYLKMYKGIPFSPITSLSESINETDTVIHVTNSNAFPDGPNYATIGTDEGAETIFYAQKAEGILSGCKRGIEGIARQWQAEEPIARNFTAEDYHTIIDNLSKVIDDLTKKADKVTDSTEGNLASLDENGNLQDSGQSVKTLTAGGRSIVLCDSEYNDVEKVHILTPKDENQTIPASGMVPVTFIPDADYHKGDKLRFNGQDCDTAYSNTDLAVADGAFRSGFVTSVIFQFMETGGGADRTCLAILHNGAALYARNAGKLNGLTPQAYIQIQENLLINWDLKNPVNQQNKTNYTEIGYCIDMWYGGLAAETTTGYSLSITSNGLVLLPLHFIQQNFEQVSWEGEFVTFALLIDGTLYTASWKWSKDTEYELIANFRGLLIRYSGKYKYIQLLNPTTDNLILQAAKAEKGAIFTGWPAWDYGAELAKCQRYYFNTINKDNYASVSSAAYARTNNRLQCVINAPASMRTKPVPKIIGKLLVRTYNGAIIKEISADIASTNCGSSLPWALYLDITLTDGTTPFTPGEYYNLILETRAGNYLEFNANL